MSNQRKVTRIPRCGRPAKQFNGHSSQLSPARRCRRACCGGGVDEMAGNMNNHPTMVRSTTDRVSTLRPQITKADIGKRVLVGGAKHGTLRYIGKVIDKDGMFCGIELDHPEGKHNGTFGDVTYFVCRPKTGIFAPLYKVELEPDTCAFEAKEAARTKMNKSDQGMVRSSMPAIEGEDEQLQDVYPHLEASMMNPSWTNSNSLFDATDGIILEDSMSFKENLSRPRRTSSHGDNADLFSTTPPEGFFEENIASAEPSPGPDATMSFLSISQTIENPKMSRSELPVVESDQETEEEVHRSMPKSRRLAEAEEDARTPLAEEAPTATQSPTNAHEAQNRSVSSCLSVDTGYQGDTDCSTSVNDAQAALPSPASQDNENAVTAEWPAASDPTTTTPVANAARQPLPEAASTKTQLTVSDATTLSTERSKEGPPTAASKTSGPSPRGKTVTNVQDSQPQSTSKRLNQKVKEPVPLQSPAVKAAARAPKAPSKSQQMMEQIKASIEAEKNKPKREVKSKLADIIATPPVVTKLPSDENKGPEGDTMPVPAALTPTPTTTTSGSAPKRTKLTPLLGKNIPPAPPRNPPKPRQSLLPPPAPRTTPTVSVLAATSANVASSFTKSSSERPTSRSSKLPEPRSRNGSVSSSASRGSAAPVSSRPPRPTPSVSPRPTAVKSANAVNGTDRKRQPSGTPGSAMPSASSTSTVGLRPSKPTGEPKASTSNGTTSNGATAALPVPSSHAIRSRPTPNGKPAAPASNTSVELKRLHEEVNMGQKRLAYAVKGFDALAVVAEHSRRKMTALNTQRIDTERRLRQNIDDLAGKIETLTSERTQLCELHTRSLESLHNKHADEVKRVTGQHQQELERAHQISQQEKEQLRKDAQEALERALGETQALHNEAVDAMSRQHQHQCSLLDEKLAEAEKMIVQLKKDKVRLETTLAKDRDEKVKTLTAEVSSLNTALELRSTEIRELRQKNSKLQLEAEIIPVLESEKKKLELRVEDLQQIIENRKNTEKLLTSRCEELQRSANKKAEMSQSVLMENDMLRYRLEEMETSASEGEGVGPMLSSTMWYTPQMSSSQNYSRTLPVSAGRRSRSSHSSDTGAKEGEASALPPAAAAAPSSHNAALMTRSMEGDDVMSQSLVSVYKQQGRERRSRILDDDTICTPEGVYHASELEAAVNGGHRIRMKARLSFDDNDASSSARSPTKGVADSGIFSSIHSQRTADNDDEASS